MRTSLFFCICLASKINLSCSAFSKENSNLFCPLKPLFFSGVRETYFAPQVIFLWRTGVLVWSIGHKPRTGCWPHRVATGYGLPAEYMTRKGHDQSNSFLTSRWNNRLPPLTLMQRLPFSKSQCAYVTRCSQNISLAHLSSEGHKGKQ